MNKNTLKTGFLGETAAEAYLLNKGYKIIDRDYRTKYAEIDLIAWDKDVLVFIEVKTRAGEFSGAPEEAIGKDKINRLINHAGAYAAMKNYGGACRIDTACVVLDGRERVKRVAHYENITQ